MAFIASYDGQCVACGKAIVAGKHEIQHSYAHAGGYKHSNCNALAMEDYFLPPGDWDVPALDVDVDFSNITDVSQIPIDSEEIGRQLEQLKARIEEYSKIREDFRSDHSFFKDQRVGYSDIIKRSRAEEEQEIARIQREYMERRAGWTEQMQSALREEEAIRRLMDEAQANIDSETARLGNIYELWTARQALIDLKSEFAEIMAEMPWAEKMKGYQQDDILHSLHTWREKPNEGILNANPMGLGKTFEAGAFIDLFREMFTATHEGRRPRILWLTRKTLIKGTISELMRWNGDRKCAAIEGPPQQRELMLQFAIAADAIIMANYEALNTTPVIMDISWDLVVIDEVHHLKGGANSSKTKIWLNTRDIMGIIENPEYTGNYYDDSPKWIKKPNSPFCYMISGSPMQNKPEEMWAYLHLFHPEQFPTVKKFKQLFAPYGGLETHLLLDAMQGRFIRNDPNELGIERPEKHHVWVEVDLGPEQREMYDRVRDYILDVELGGEDRELNLTSVIAMLTRAWQVVMWPPSIKFEDQDGTIYGPGLNESAKIDEAMTIIENLVDEGEQVVVWTARFNDPLYELGKRLADLGITYALMTGDAKDQLHDFEVEFQNGNIDVLLCQRMSVGEGFNFQVCDEWPGGAAHEIMLDRWWNPMGNEQMYDRCWRMNSTRDVTIHQLVAANTLDAFVLAINEEKQNMIDPVMGSARLRPLSEWRDMLRELM